MTLAILRYRGLLTRYEINMFIMPTFNYDDFINSKNQRHEENQRNHLSNTNSNGLNFGRSGVRPAKHTGVSYL